MKIEVYYFLYPVCTPFGVLWVHSLNVPHFWVHYSNIPLLTVHRSLKKFQAQKIKIILSWRWTKQFISLLHYLHFISTSLRYIYQITPLDLQNLPSILHCFFYIWFFIWKHNNSIRSVTSKLFTVIFVSCNPPIFDTLNYIIVY